MARALLKPTGLNSEANQLGTLIEDLTGCRPPAHREVDHPGKPVLYAEGC